MFSVVPATLAAPAVCTKPPDVLNSATVSAAAVPFPATSRNCLPKIAGVRTGVPLIAPTPAGNGRIHLNRVMPTFTGPEVPTLPTLSLTVTVTGTVPFPAPSDENVTCDG